MEFGVMASVGLGSSKDLPGREPYEFVMKVSQAASESGFDALGVANRHLAGPTDQFMSPLVMATHLLSVFPHMKVSTNVLLLPYHNPVMLAEQVATMDLISPGKLLLGVGQGYRANEAAIFGIEHKERGRRLAESIRIVRMLWGEGASSYDGEFWTVDNADIGVKPLNAPPILIAGDGVKAIGLIPERGGDFWYPSSRASTVFLREKLPYFKEGLERLGKPFRGIPLIRDICVAGSRAEAEDIMREGISQYLTRQMHAGQPGEDLVLSFDELKKDRLIFGSSEEAAEELIALNREFGARFINMRVFLPGMDRERVLDVIRQLGEEVLPLVRGELGTASLFDA
jgi:alkanesulfonate monooxygenase SsuD/methylene tetrahydromethanopterin reductase-like flavin-dependent oxidoreductase (luciferase family)